MDGARVNTQLDVFGQKYSLVVRSPFVGDVQLRISALLRIQQPGSFGNDSARTVAGLSRSMSGQDVFAHARVLDIPV